MAVSITVTLDFICPWCLIGERRLAAAVASLPKGVVVATTWRPYEVYADFPPEGVDRRAYHTMRFGSWESSQRIDARTIEVARGDDVEFDYDVIEKIPNTFLAHRLVWFAKDHHKLTSVVDAILSGYFEHGQDIGDAITLADIAAEQGFDREQVLRFLACDEGSEEVRALEHQALAGSFQGVPNFQIGGFVISGVQPVGVLRDAILKAHSAADAAA